MNITIESLFLADMTVGFAQVGDFRFCTLELPWKFNQKMVSCIPRGYYEAFKLKHHKFGNCIQLLDVPERTEIFMHSGNYLSEIKGCILPGSGFNDINKDGKLDIVNSAVTLQKIFAMLPEKFGITIRRHG
jgi:Family of unknown function (DUF5675)